LYRPHRYYNRTARELPAPYTPADNIGNFWLAPIREGFTDSAGLAQVDDGGTWGAL